MPIPSTFRDKLEFDERTGFLCCGDYSVTRSCVRSTFCKTGSPAKLVFDKLDAKLHDVAHVMPGSRDLLIVGDVLRQPAPSEPENAPRTLHCLVVANSPREEQHVSRLSDSPSEAVLSNPIVFWPLPNEPLNSPTCTTTQHFINSLKHEQDCGRLWTKLDAWRHGTKEV